MKLISINIEREKHLDLVLPFIEQEGPDVLCLQEVCENDLHSFANLGYIGKFLPETCSPVMGVQTVNGNALLARSPLFNIQTYYYQGTQATVCDFDRNNMTKTQQKSIIHADCDINGDIFRIGTTHFTWALNGREPSEEQIANMKKFLSYISGIGPHIMCGDFNIPRHYNFLYEQLLKYYTDAVPLHYPTSLDSLLHKLKDNPEKKQLLDIYMVDYVFTQPPYQASDVRLEFGLSDHAGVVATITK